MMLCALSACAETPTQETSEFTANIDKYWQEHDIDGMLAARNNSEEALADTGTQMLAMYGENKEITGDYDGEPATKTVSGTYVGQVVSDEVVSWKGIPYVKQPAPTTFHSFFSRDLCNSPSSLSKKGRNIDIRNH